LCVEIFDAEKERAIGGLGPLVGRMERGGVA
jgi:hypothetical protein